MRTEALDAIKRACQAHGTARTNMVTRWEALRTAGHLTFASTPPEIAALLATHTETLAMLRGRTKKAVGMWTNSSAPARTQELAQLIGRLGAAATSISVRVMATEDRVKRQRNIAPRCNPAHRVAACAAVACMGFLCAGRAQHCARHSRRRVYIYRLPAGL